MDYIAMAETLEAQAASLRREAARLAAAEQPQLPLENEWRDHDGGEQPPETYGKNVDVRLRDDYEMSGPAAAITWGHGEPYEGAPQGSRDVVAWRLSAEQPAQE